jgi:hypothetical protein
VTRRLERICRGAIVAVAVTLLPAAAAHAAPAPEPSVPPGTVPEQPLIPVPVGCPRPDPAAVVFVGEMIGKDDVTQVVRFRIDQIRSGSASPWAIDGLVDIRYGDDYRFLDKGESYLVGAGFDPAYGSLVSTVRPPEPSFGGNDVIGVDDVAVVCPELDDPVRTLNIDGTSVDSGILSQLTEDRRLLLATIAVPVGIAFAVLIGLVLVKMFARLAVDGVAGLGRAAVTPVPDHRAVRVRTHRSADPPEAAN